MTNGDERRREQIIDHLIDEGEVSADQMQQYLLEVERSGQSLLDVLYDRAEGDPEAWGLAGSIADLFDADVVEVSDLDGHPATMTVLPESLAKERGVLGCVEPDREDRVALIVYDPLGLESLLETVEAAAGARPAVFLAPRGPLLKVIDEVYASFDESSAPGATLPAASVFDGVRPMVFGESLESDDETASEEESSTSSGDEGLDDESLGEDLERAVTESLDDLEGMFGESSVDGEESESDWFTEEEDDEFWSEEPDESAEGEDAAGRRYAGPSVGEDVEESEERERDRPSVGAEQRGSTPFGEIVEPSAGLDEDTATRAPELEEARSESESGIGTKQAGEGGDDADAFADAWEESTEGTRPSSERDGSKEFEDVMSVVTELEGPPPEEPDRRPNQEDSREEMAETLETHARMLRRLHRRLNYQKRIVEGLSRLLVETEVVSRGELYNRLQEIRREFVEEYQEED